MVHLESSTVTATDLFFANCSTTLTEGDIASGIVMVSSANLIAEKLVISGCSGENVVAILKDNATMTCNSCHVIDN